MHRAQCKGNFPFHQLHEQVTGQGGNVGKEAARGIISPNSVISR